jgi:hypothetical protein
MWHEGVGHDRTACSTRNLHHGFPAAASTLHLGGGGVSYYWINLSDIMAMPNERFTALQEWLSARGLQLAIAINNDAAPLDSDLQRDLDEEAEAQGVHTKDLLTMERQSGVGT